MRFLNVNLGPGTPSEEAPAANDYDAVRLLNAHLADVEMDEGTPYGLPDTDGTVIDISFIVEAPARPGDLAATERWAVEDEPGLVHRVQEFVTTHGWPEARVWVTEEEDY